MAGFGRAAVGSAPTSVVRHLSGAVWRRMAPAPIRVFVCVVASKLKQETTYPNPLRAEVFSVRLCAEALKRAGTQAGNPTDLPPVDASIIS